MRRCITMFTGAFIVAASMVSVAFAAAVRNSDSPDRWAQPGRVVVKLRDHTGALPAPQKTGRSALDEVLARHAVELVRPLAPGLRAPSKPGGTDLRALVVVHYAGGSDPYRVAAELTSLPDVEYAEPLYAYRLNAVPNDDDFATQNLYLGPTTMQFTEAWDVVKGEDADVVVAVIDGGTYWRHLDLEANMWTNTGEIPDNGVDDDGNGFTDDVHGWNFGNGTGDPTGLPSTPISGAHGTHTAGIVCAVANNDTIIAGASWNARLMAVAAGIEGLDQAIGAGYEGIVYAAANGADVISMSWGGPGPPSLAELEIIQYANEQGAALVAAAGNGPSNADDHFPSAYPHVLSVANVQVIPRDVKVFSSNFGLTVDVSAQGQGIWSTVPPPTLAGSSSGTSMSAPHVAAACALVKTRWPEYTADQVMEQVRLTSDDIYGIQQNAQWRGLLGRGRINALRAVTESTPAVVVSDMSFETEDGDETMEPGESVTINLTLTNILAAAQDLSFTLNEGSQFITITTPTKTLPALDNMQSAVLAFEGQISSSAPEHLVVQATLDITAMTPDFSDVAHVQFVIQPVFANHLANNIDMSVTSVGRYGFGTELGGNGLDGIGFSFKGGPLVLFEGAMMIGSTASNLQDAARDQSGGNLQSDFSTRTDGTPAFIESNPIADEQSVALFGSSPASALPLTVRQDVYGFVDAPDDDYLIYRYEITNDSTLPINGLRVGWFNDWDIGFVFNDLTGYDALRGLGYSFDIANEATSAYFGNVVLSDPGATAFTGILNDESLGGPWGIYDGFTKSEKWQSITNGVWNPTMGPEDISYSIGTGPFNLGAGETLVIAMAYVAGDDLTDLQANADQALSKWGDIEPITPVRLQGFTAVQELGDVVLSWRTDLEDDVLGYRVFRGRPGGALVPVADVALSPSKSYTYRDANLEPGRYTYRIAEVTGQGNILLHGGVEIEVLAAAPARNFIAPNVPNPFNPRTTLSYGLAQGGPVTLRVYDGRGRLVRTLERLPYRPAGFYSTTWDGLDDSGQAVASGVYHARLDLAGVVLTRRMTLLK